MKDTTLKLGAAALGVAATTAIVAGGVYAFGPPVQSYAARGYVGARAGGIRCEKSAEFMKHRIDMRAAIESGDYGLLGENPKISEEQFQNMVKIHKLMKEGKTEEAKALRKELGMPMGRPMGMRGNKLGFEKMNNIKEAIEANDYSLLGENPKITEEQFNKMVENYEKNGNIFNKRASVKIRQ